jgi:putative GTP pyrophosphokinase
MTSVSSTELVDQFKSKRPGYERFGKKLEPLLVELLERKGIRVQDVTHRVKDPEHLREKIERPGKSYGSLEAVTDLLGVRIITFFLDDVNEVADLVEREFIVDHNRSANRGDEDTQQFGYRSVHKIVSLPPRRTGLGEWADFDGLFCEIQIRSILGHAWAEIEHDLGYKAGTGVPSDVRRRFARLSALLELADDEFLRLRDDIYEYARDARESVVERPRETPVNTVTLAAFLNSDPTVRHLVQQFSEIFETEPTSAEASPLEERVDELAQLGIHSIDALGRKLAAEAPILPAFVEHFFGRRYGGAWPISLLLFLLAQIVAARAPSEEEAFHLFDEMNIAARPERRGYVRQLRAFLNAAPPTPQAIA